MTRGRGRPAIGPQTQIRFPPAMTEALDAIAEAEGISRAELVRRIVAEDLARGRVFGSREEVR